MTRPDEHPLDVAATAADEALVEALRRGERPTFRDPPQLAELFAAWVSEIRGETIMDFRTTAQKVAEGAARRDDRDTEETRYRLRLRAGIPLADAGQSCTVEVTGKATRRELTAQLEQEGFRVERIEKKIGILWW